MDSPAPTDTERADEVARAAAARALVDLAGVEFTTWKCGTALPADLAGATHMEKAMFREAVRVRLRALLEAAWPDRRLDRLVPDVAVDAAPDTLGVTIDVAPVLVAGRYRKLVRGISQTVLHCRRCRGRPRGCDVCAGSGRVYPESVEDFVRPAIERAVGGTGSAFHGSGREDTDVRMLGSGRPFVVSVASPRLRSIDGADAAAEVERASGGRVVVSDVAVVSREEAKRITTDHGRKTYRVVVEPTGAADLPADAPERLRVLAGAELSQRTPRRVDGRRADMVRLRRVLGVDVDENGPRRLVATVRTDPGTYVKELVSGDDGRTEPSVAGLLGVACACTELDVLGVDAGVPAGAAEVTS